MLCGGIDKKAEIVQPMPRLGLTGVVGEILRKQRSEMTGQDGQQGRRFIDEPDNRCAIPKINRQCITPPGTGIDRHQVGEAITRLEGEISMTLIQTIAVINLENGSQISRQRKVGIHTFGDTSQSIQQIPTLSQWFGTLLQKERANQDIEKGTQCRLPEAIFTRLQPQETPFAKLLNK